jgi:hypothetical protein
VGVVFSLLVLLFQVFGVVTMLGFHVVRFFGLVSL